MTFGVGISYLIVVGGLMPDVGDYLNFGTFMSSRYVWITIGFMIVGPMSCLKTLDALKYTSAAAVFFVGFIALLILSYAVSPSLSPCDDDGTGCVGTHTSIMFDEGSMRVLGVFIFAYTCQMNIFPVVNELKNPTMKRFNVVTNSAIFTACSLYIVVAACGYAIYGSEINADVLVSFPGTVYCLVYIVYMLYIMTQELLL